MIFDDLKTDIEKSFMMADCVKKEQPPHGRFHHHIVSIPISSGKKSETNQTI